MASDLAPPAPDGQIAQPPPGYTVGDLGGAAGPLPGPNDPPAQPQIVHAVTELLGHPPVRLSDGYYNAAKVEEWRDKLDVQVVSHIMVLNIL